MVMVFEFLLAASYSFAFMHVCMRVCIAYTKTAAPYNSDVCFARLLHFITLYLDCTMRVGYLAYITGVV
jgi:hypothetical protein